MRQALATLPVRWAGVALILYVVGVGLMFATRSPWSIAPLLLGAGMYMAAAFSGRGGPDDAGAPGAYGSPFGGGDGGGGGG